MCVRFGTATEVTVALCDLHREQWLRALDHQHPGPTGWIQHGDMDGQKSADILRTYREERHRTFGSFVRWVEESCANGEGCRHGHG